MINPLAIGMRVRMGKSVTEPSLLFMIFHHSLEVNIESGISIEQEETVLVQFYLLIRNSAPALTKGVFNEVVYLGT